MNHASLKSIAARSGIASKGGPVRRKTRRQAGGLPERPPLPDYLRPGLDVVFVGFNPGDRSSRLGHYYAGRGNQFWGLLSKSNLVPERLTYEDDRRLPEFGIGLTDVVKRWSKSSNDLRAEDYRAGVPQLRAKLLEAPPRAVAFNGIGAYRRFGELEWEGFRGRLIQPGLQPEIFAGARVFALPSTSALNARLTPAQKLVHFRQLAEWVKRHGR